MGHRHWTALPCPCGQGGIHCEPLGNSLVYVAAPGKEFPDIASVDKAGVRIGTIRGAPSDRVLTREIKAAEIVRSR